MAMVVIQKDETDHVHSTNLSRERSKRFDGVVGYRICLTHRRPPVRTRVEPFLWHCTFAVYRLHKLLSCCVPPATMLPWLLVGAFLGHAILSSCAASLGERAFPTLSSSALADLANMRDASKNLDASDYYSHLQKILIPRPGTYTIRAWFANQLISVQPTLKTTPLFEITSFQRSASSIGT